MMIANFGTDTASTTLYLGPLEVQNFGGVTTDHTYVDTPHPDIRVTNGVVSYLHHDQLGSVVMITDAAGARARELAYRPYGEVLNTSTPLPAVPAEARGFIGERYDAGAGLQYLNARYHDPQLGFGGGTWVLHPPHAGLMPPSARSTDTTVSPYRRTSSGANPGGAGWGVASSQTTSAPGAIQPPDWADCRASRPKPLP